MTSSTEAFYKFLQIKRVWRSNLLLTDDEMSSVECYTQNEQLTMFGSGGPLTETLTNAKNSPICCLSPESVQLPV